MEFLFFFGALGLGLAAVFGPEVRVCLRHRRFRRPHLSHILSLPPTHSWAHFR